MWNCHSFRLISVKHAKYVNFSFNKQYTFCFSFLIFSTSQLENFAHVLSKNCLRSKFLYECSLSDKIQEEQCGT
jgi:hypothetical protein